MLTLGVVHKEEKLQSQLNFRLAFKVSVQGCSLGAAVRTTMIIESEREIKFQDSVWCVQPAKRQAIPVTTQRKDLERLKKKERKQQQNAHWKTPSVEPIKETLIGRL